MSPDLEAIEAAIVRLRITPEGYAGDLDAISVVIHAAPSLLAAARERDQLRADLAAARLDAANARAVAVEACESLRGEDTDPDGEMADGYLRRLAHPDAAKVREAVERYGRAVERSSGWRDSNVAAEALTERSAAKAALLALIGGGE